MNRFGFLRKGLGIVSVLALVDSGQVVQPVRWWNLYYIIIIHILRQLAA